jgi:hypothetical protein
MPRPFVAVALLAAGALGAAAAGVAPAGAQQPRATTRPQPPRGARPRPGPPGERTPTSVLNDRIDTTGAHPAGARPGRARADSSRRDSTRRDGRRPAAAPAVDPARPIKEFGTMWTFDAPPLAYWKARYNFTPDQAWLDNVRLSALRIPGCSSSLVSADGLLMTNHHCGRQWVTQVAPKDTNYHEAGWAARSRADEKRVPGAYAERLESIEDVTARVRAAVTAGGAAAQARQRADAVAAVERECSAQTRLDCQVVTFYQGGRYSLYRYRRFDDVRLVMVPEEQIAFYGGDPDNFTYPRFDLDVSFFRVYDNGRPLRTANYLRWNAAGPRENDPVFVVGNPGSTGRLLTVAQMEYLRDVQYPAQLAQLARQTAVAEEVVRTATPERQREVRDLIFGLANSRKATTGYLGGLRDSSIMARKRAFEADFRRRVDADPALRARYGTAWDEIARAQRGLAALATRRRVYAFGSPYPSLWQFAGALVQLPAEAAKPDSARLPGYRGPALDALRARLARPAPVDKAGARLTMAAELRAAQQALPADDPVLAALLGGRTPEAAAAALVDGTRLDDAAVRAQLLAGGAAAVAASTDPLVAAARAVDRYNREVEAQAQPLLAAVANNAERVGEAIFAAYGTALPPDATFTLRITDGVVKGYPMNGTVAPWKTTFYGLYDRAASFDNRGDFRLPARWADPARRARLDLATPYDFVTTNDIIGGNSGSPMVDRAGRVVGLIFDGNIESLPNRFIFTDEAARTVAVTSQALTEALRKMYDAGWVADELEGRAAATSSR